MNEVSDQFTCVIVLKNRYFLISTEFDISYGNSGRMNEKRKPQNLQNIFPIIVKFTILRKIQPINISLQLQKKITK